MKISKDESTGKIIIEGDGDMLLSNKGIFGPAVPDNVEIRGLPVVPRTAYDILQKYGMKRLQRWLKAKARNPLL